MTSSLPPLGMHGLVCSIAYWVQHFPEAIVSSFHLPNKAWPQVDGGRNILLHPAPMHRLAFYRKYCFRFAEKSLRFFVDVLNESRSQPNLTSLLLTLGLHVVLLIYIVRRVQHFTQDVLRSETLSTSRGYRCAAVFHYTRPSQCH